MNSDGKPTTVQETPCDTQLNIVLDADRQSDDDVDDGEFQKEEKVLPKQKARNNYALPVDEDEDDYEEGDFDQRSSNNQ